MLRGDESRRERSSRPAPAVVLLDTVVDEIDRALVQHPAERGGALIGPEGRELVTHLLYDTEARTTNTSYEPSDALLEHVAASEDDSALRWKGMIHSHPGGFAELSGPDLERLLDGLSNNPWLPWLHAPIVTHHPPSGRRQTALPVGSGWLTWHTARLLRNGRMVVEQRHAVVLPLGGSLRRLAEGLGCEWEILVADPGTGVTGVGGRLTLTDGRELLILVGEHFPLVAPLVLVSEGGQTRELTLDWSASAGERRLAEAVMDALERPGKDRRQDIGAGAFGPRPDLPVTLLADRARLARWGPAAGDCEATRAMLRQQLKERGRGLIGEVLGAKSIAVVGCGSVGSYAAEQLARTGIGALVLVDADEVDATNLARTCFDIADLGVPKVHALARRLLNVNPSVSIDTHAANVGAMGPGELDGIIERVDLLLAATDDPIAQLELARCAQRHGRPALFVGLTAGARGGEVVVTVPGRTPCYRCATSIRHDRDAEPELRADLDYGTGRLHGVIALGVDIQHVAGVAVKVALSLLLRDDADAELGRQAEGFLARDISFLTFSMSEDYWIYPGLFGTVPGQFGYQSLGIQVEADPSCPICGPNARLTDAAELGHPPDSAEIRAAWARGQPSADPTSTHSTPPALSEQGRGSDGPGMPDASRDVGGRAPNPPARHAPAEKQRAVEEYLRNSKRGDERKENDGRQST